MCMGGDKNGGILYTDLEAWCEGYLPDSEFERKCALAKKFYYKIAFVNSSSVRVVMEGHHIIQWNKPLDGLKFAQLAEVIFNTDVIDVIEFKELF